MTNFKAVIESIGYVASTDINSFIQSDQNSYQIIEKPIIKRGETKSQVLLKKSTELALSQMKNRKVTESLGIIVGTNYSHFSEAEEFDKRVYDKGPRGVTPMMVPNILPNASASKLGMEHKARALNLTVSTGETVSTDILGISLHKLKKGDATMIIGATVEENSNFIESNYSKSSSLDFIENSICFILSTPNSKLDPKINYYLCDYYPLKDNRKDKLYIDNIIKLMLKRNNLDNGDVTIIINTPLSLKNVHSNYHINKISCEIVSSKGMFGLLKLFQLSLESKYIIYIDHYEFSTSSLLLEKI